MQIASQMKNQILTGEIAAGSTLPSERSMAQILGVHRNTVVRAYSELKDQELIDSRQGVGYVVNIREAEGSNTEAVKGKKVHWPSQIREKYQDLEVTFDDMFQRFQEENVISLGSGIATTEIYDT